MKCSKSLTAEKVALILFDGNVSDIDLVDDEDNDESDTGHLDPPEYSQNSNTNGPVPDIGVEVEMVDVLQEGAEDAMDMPENDGSIETEADMVRGFPFSKRNVRWRLKDIETVDRTCNIVLSDPPHDITPYQYFQKIFDDKLLTNLVDQTNLYSVQKCAVSINTTKDELEQFLGIYILAGIVKMPSYRMYWQNSTRYAPIADVMSRNRFEKLKRFLHINNNDNMKPREDPSHDKLFKIRPFIDYIKKKFQNIEHEEYNSVDEILIPFKGHSALKQYIKSKPHKWGIKLFARAGSSGIIYDFEVYVGKGTLNKKSELGISGDIVIRLAETVPKDRNFKIITDNWFSSLKLSIALKDVGLLSIGTVRCPRLLGCSFKSDKDLQSEGRGSCDYRTEVGQNIVAVKWYDNRSVHLISSYVGKHPNNQVARWSVADKKCIQIPRPAIVEEYNKSMGGVDLSDMLVALYRTSIGVKRYYFKIFFHLMDVAVVNSWLLYRRHCLQRKETKYIKLVDFRASIGQALTLAKKETKKRGRPSLDSTPVCNNKKKEFAPVVPVDDVRYDGLNHWPTHQVNKERCKYANCRINAYSRTICSKCKIALCLNKDRNCFMDYHVKN